jgi:DNA transformation protein
MAVSESFLSYVMDQLTDFGDFQTKKMFGGVGIYHEGLMFALVGNEKFCLKADDSNRADFEAYGMRAFLSDENTKGLPYWEVPVEIMEDREVLADWAHKAYQVAVQAKKKPKKRK